MSALLAWSVGLFLAMAGFNVVIGVATPISLPFTKPTALFMTKRSDQAAFGHDPEALLAGDAGLLAYRNTMLSLLGGLLLLLGLLQGAVAWWGLRAGARWALVVLTVVGLVAVATWLWVSRPYFGNDPPLALADVPPFMWFTTALWVPATITGWLALARSA